MVQFLKWVKENVPRGTMTELSAQDYLYALRAEQEDYIEPSSRPSPPTRQTVR